MSPLVSIIMGVYNNEATLADAIESIVEQTYTQWQLIICDDGSTDNSYAIAKKFADAYPAQVVVLRNDSNKGLNQTLNRCLQAAKGEYIARQDGDDTSVPTRLKTQVETLESHPQYAIVSTAMTLFDEAGDWGTLRRKATPQYADLIYGTPFAHAPSMVRAKALHQVNGYSEERRLLRVEDYHLWYKMYKAGFSGINLEESLYRCRDDRNAQQRRKYRYRVNESYVKWLILRAFKLPAIQFAQVLKPLLVGLLPPAVYRRLHRVRVEHV